MEAGRRPLVSVGLPVYNGERSVARALECLLGQDYSNLEILISDNASTDGTRAICERYAARDPRVKYYRADRNRGSRWNFNRVFELASGEFFMWAAHDDEREPTFVSACVDQLERNPDAVLCQVHTDVSAEGYPGTMYLARLDTFADKHDPVARYRETLLRFPATAIYGLYRTSAMRKTRMLEAVIATDLAFIQELSIHGRFVQVEQRLFNYRARHRWNSIDDDARVFLGLPAKPWWYSPLAFLYLNHLRRVTHAPVSWTLKTRLGAVLVVHLMRQVVFKSLLAIAGRACPAGRRDGLGTAIYWRSMHNPNLDVLNRDAFVERVCKPQVGWWR